MNNTQNKFTTRTNPIRWIHNYEDSFLNEKYSYEKHFSGLDVYVFPKKTNSTMAIIGTRFGSVDNTFKTSKKAEFITVPDGVAHFLEHKLFENENGSDSFERFSQLGADANAYTSSNRTAYYFECTKNFNKNLEELISFVFSPHFTKQGINKEIGIIAEEIRMYDDNPYDRCYYGMLEGLYARHSVKRNICGSEESIKKITPEILHACHKVFYSPSNMVLAVCGNTTLDNVKNIVDKVLPERKRARKIILSNENLLEPREVHKKLVTNKMNVSKPIFSIGIKDTDIPRSKISALKKDIMMALLGNILFSRSSVFDNQLVSNGLITGDLRYEYTLCETFAFSSISGKSDSPEKVFEEILSYLKEIKESGISREDFMREKKVMLTEHICTFDSPARIANSLFSNGCTKTDIFHTHKLIKSIKLSDIEALFEKAFDEELFTMSVVYPIENQ